MPNSETNSPEIGRDEEERYRQIKEWAEYVRTHPDDDWGPQVNKLIESQLQTARARQFERPDLAHLRDPAEEDNDIQRPEIARKRSGDAKNNPSRSDPDDAPVESSSSNGDGDSKRDGDGDSKRDGDADSKRGRDADSKRDGDADSKRGRDADSKRDGDANSKRGRDADSKRDRE
jgi:hypothetical protein